MAQRYWATYEKPLRDKLRDLINTRAGADAITVAEIKAALWATHDRYAANGIYVGLPHVRPLEQGQESEANTSILTFPVVCNIKSWTEAEQLDLLGKFVSLVVDAVEANPTFDGAAEHAWVEDVGEPEPGIGGPDQFSIMRVVRVAVEVTRTTT